MQLRRNRIYATAIGTLMGVASMAVGAFLVPTNRFVAGAILFTAGVILYFYFVFFCCERNYLDIRAVFPAVWQCTIGLAALRLTEYQVQWETKTWVCLILAYAVYQIGVSVGILWGGSLHIRPVLDRFGKSQWRIHDERLFWICIFVTLSGLACFIINVLIRGYVPFLESKKNMNAYVEFYTRFQIFSTAEVCISPLCYYCLKTQRLPGWKRAALVCCIVYSTFLYPVFVVSRGAFMTSALMLTCAVFYSNRRKFWILIACVVAAAGVYGGCSALRGYSNEQLNEFFEPAQVQVGSSAGVETPDAVEAETGNQDSAATVQSEQPANDASLSSNDGKAPEPLSEVMPAADENTGRSFVLSPKWAFVYTYLTVSHDNLNEAVKYTSQYTYGIRQMEPFNVLLRCPGLQKAIEAAPHYLVRKHLNTVDLIGDAYYDFGVIGVAVCMLLWSFLFGAIQQIYFVGGKPFALLALGNVLTPVALCFFDSWMSEFSFWMYWGLTLVMLFAAAVPGKSKMAQRRILLK